jgi:hypothetical protein
MPAYMSTFLTYTGLVATVVPGRIQWALPYHPHAVAAAAAATLAVPGVPAAVAVLVCARNVAASADMPTVAV